MIAWILACGAVVLLLIFFALWRRERVLRLDAEKEEKWWREIAEDRMEIPSGHTGFLKSRWWSMNAGNIGEVFHDKTGNLSN